MLERASHVRMPIRMRTPDPIGDFIPRGGMLVRYAIAGSWTCDGDPMQSVQPWCSFTSTPSRSCDSAQAGSSWDLSLRGQPGSWGSARVVLGIFHHVEVYTGLGRECINLLVSLALGSRRSTGTVIAGCGRKALVPHMLSRSRTLRMYRGALIRRMS